MEKGPRAEAQTQWLRCVAYALGTDDVPIMSQALRVHEAVWGRLLVMGTIVHIESCVAE